MLRCPLLMSTPTVHFKTKTSTAHLTGQQSCKVVDETLKPSVFSLKTQDQNHKSKETNATVEVLLIMISFSKVL